MSRAGFIFLVFSNFFFSQRSAKEIDSLMTTEYYQLRSQRKFQEIIVLCESVIKDAKKINYIKGEIYAYARLGNMQCNMKNYRTALQNLNYANKLIEESEINDNVIKASIHLGTGICYSEPGTSYQNAKYEYDKALFFAEKITNKDERKFYQYLIYTNFYALYSTLKDKEKEVFYLRKSLSIKKSPYMLTELARYHNIYSKNKDSARFYLERSQKIAFTDFEKAALYNQWGKYYEENREFRKAIEFYKKNESLAIKTNEAPLQEDALVGLYNCNTKIGDLKKAIYYSERRNKFNDSMNLLKLKNSNVAINDIVQKKEKDVYLKFSGKQKVYLVLTFIALGIVSVLVIKLYKNHQDKKKTLYLIDEKEEENQELKQKVNESFEEVVTLAKNNSPEFFTRFTEVYPDFIKHLLEYNPKLRNSELILCSYIFLGFTSKDIARYTFKSINTIKARKYNLRKKLEIPTEETMEIWLMNLN